MTINNLSGNFQPLTSVGGRSLPQTKPQSNNDPASTTTNLVDATSKSLTVKPSGIETQAQDQALGERFEGLSQLAQNIQRRLSFQVDDVSGKTVVKVYDRETEELIRQFPPEELLTLSQRLKELNDEINGGNNAGILIKSEA
jgi:flagellar protein FlaG